MDFVASETAGRWIAHQGEQADRWLEALPAIVAHYELEWGLRVTSRLDGGSVSVALTVDTADGSAVLKLAAPWSPTAAAEGLALRTWKGVGAPALFKASRDGTALLMERVVPGSAALGLSANEVADLLLTLREAAPPPALPTMTDAVRIRFLRAAENRHRLVDRAQLEAARRAALALAGNAESEPGFTLVHGDLLSKNILKSCRSGVLAIDPNPFRGDIAFDAALWSLTESPVDEAPVRGEAMAELLAVPATRVLGWMAVLAAVEASLAPLARAEASLELAASLSAGWLNPN